MRKRSRPAKRLLGLLATLPLAACATQTPDPSSNMVTKLFRPVPNYSAAPCEMQREWAAHNSKVASIEAGRAVVYKAPCDVDPKKPAPVASKVPDGLDAEVEFHKNRPRPEVERDKAKTVGGIAAPEKTT